jgi:undecaprenyl-diphosphatase
MTLSTTTISLTQQIQNPALTTFFKFISIITEPLVIFILTIIISATLYINRKKHQAILLATASITTAIIITAVKNLLKIPRPTTMLIRETGYSLPSGHTTFAVVFFGLLAFIFAKREHKIPVTIISIFLILIIAFSRLYLQAHWLTDILAGIVIGTTILTTTILTYKKFT